MKKLFESKNFRHGSVASAITVVVLVVLILINVLCSALTQKFPLTIDLTPQKIFRLTDQSIDFVKALDRDIEINVLTDETAFKENYRQPYEVMAKYTQYSDRVHLNFIDVVRDPAFLSQYPEELALSSGDILVTCGEKSKKVKLYDLFNIQQSRYGSVVDKSKAEQTLTSALMNVSSDKEVTVAVLTGHGEADPETLNKILADNNYNIVTVNLITEEIPADAEIAVMVGTTRDPDMELFKKLDAFLENNGDYGHHLLYAPAPTVKTEQLPNLSAFLAEWGIGVRDALVIETDNTRVFNYNPLNAVVDYAVEDISEFMDTSRMTAVPNGRELEVLFDHQIGGRSVDTFLSYSDQSSTFSLNTDDKTTGEKKVRPAFLRSSLTESKGSYLVYSSVLVCASMDALSDTMLLTSSFANSGFFVGLFNQLTEKEDSVIIESKSLLAQRFPITAAQVYTLMIIFIVLLPLTVMIAGLVIWLRRRHL